MSPVVSPRGGRMVAERNAAVALPEEAPYDAGDPLCVCHAMAYTEGAQEVGPRHEDLWVSYIKHDHPQFIDFICQI